MCFCLDPLFTRRAKNILICIHIESFRVIEKTWIHSQWITKFRYSNGWFIGKRPICNLYVFHADMSCVNVKLWTLLYQTLLLWNVKCDSSIKNYFSTQSIREQSTFVNFNLIFFIFGIIYRSEMSSKLPIIVVCSEGAKTSQDIINSECWH